jgi:hypothetical protein
MRTPPGTTAPSTTQAPAHIEAQALTQ